MRTWQHTPFMIGQCCPGVGVDCTHFVCAVLDRLYGRAPRRVRRWPSGTGIQSLVAGARVLHELLAMFPAATRVRGEALQPGDAVALKYGRGPNHVAIVGFARNTIWHCPMGPGAHVAPMPLGMFIGRVVRAYRMSDRENWWECANT